MRISDWSSDVCSSDLRLVHGAASHDRLRPAAQEQGMGSIMSVGFVRIALASVLLASATGVHAQLNYSEGYKFLEAVRDAKGQDVTALLAKTGTTVINSNERKNGEGRSEERRAGKEGGSRGRAR